MITEQERKRRRLTFRLVQVALVIVTIVLAVVFLNDRRSGDDIRINVGDRRRVTSAGEGTFSTTVPAATQLQAGDMQLFNVDSAVDLILQGRHIYAGLSPKTIEKVRSEIRKAGPDDSSGIAGFIASTVKDQVADKIGTHVRYDVDDIRDIRLEGERLVIEWKSGKEQELFGQVHTDRGRGSANRFRRDEAERFIELVKARQRGSG
jgi:hypothetical protein